MGILQLEYCVLKRIAHSKAYSRYTAMGIGSGMRNADMYIVWKNSKGGYTISRRASTAQNLPEYRASNQIAQIVSQRYQQPTWANIAFTFSRPLRADNNIEAKSPYIWANGNSEPANADNPDSTFSKHTDHGSIQDFNVLGSSADSTRTITTATTTPAQPANSKTNVACVSGNMFCLHGTPQGKDVIFTIHANAKG